MYYPCSENKDADQLRGYREADQRLCFRICKKPVFSGRGSYKAEILKFSKVGDWGKWDRYVWENKVDQDQTAFDEGPHSLQLCHSQLFANAALLW